MMYNLKYTMKHAIGSEFYVRTDGFFYKTASYETEKL